MAEYRDHVQTTLAQGVNQSLLVRQITPDPFFAGNQQAGCQSAGVQSALPLEFGQGRNPLVILRV